MENEEAYARRQSYNEIWDSLYSGSIDYLDEHFSELAPKLGTPVKLTT